MKRYRWAQRRRVLLIALALISPMMVAISPAKPVMAASSGNAYCWGSDAWGQIGDGTTATDRVIPTLVSGGLKFSSIAARGDQQSCGLTTAGAAYCWGANWAGAVGDGTNTDRQSPTAVAGGLTFNSITAGAYHFCGLTSGGVAYC